jgi:hypothetical protein
MRVVALTLAALALAPGSAGAPTTVSSGSGLRGIVTRGPITPVCIEGEPCDEPAIGVVLRFSRRGVVVARARTDPAGRYRVKLLPGRYTVTTALRAGATLTPHTARVVPARLARVDFFIDTGIR